MDKKRGGVGDNVQETDKQFVDRNGISAQMNEVITKILENRPEDPISFLADYFETLGDKTDRVSKAHQQVCLTHHSKAAFHTNVRIAYDILSQTKISRHVKGINGRVFSELLQLLCHPFPAAVKEKLMKKIRVRDYEVVKFETFKSGVFTCLVMEDFLKQADMLFKSLDTSRSGKVDRSLCEVLIQQLNKAISSTLPSNPISVLEGGYLLGPDKLYNVISNSLFNGKGSANQMSSEEFVSTAADTFLSKVQTLK